MTPKLEFEKLIKVSIEIAKNLSNLEISKPRVEQAEYDENEKVWNVVVSFLINETPNESVLSYLAFSSGDKEPVVRVYKIVKVDVDGEILGYSIYDGNRH